MTAARDLAALRARVMWHQYREWREPAGFDDPGRGRVGVRPFDGACGDCSRHRDEHPVPSLYLSPVDTARLLLSLTGGGPFVVARVTVDGEVDELDPWSHDNLADAETAAWAEGEWRPGRPRGRVFRLIPVEDAQ